MNYRFFARLVRCVDGDTFDADVDLGFHVWVRQRFRLLDVDTPERGEPGYNEATVKLSELISLATSEDGTFELESYKTEKYGRWLAMIPARGRKVGEKSVNLELADWLQATGFAKPPKGA